MKRLALLLLFAVPAFSQEARLKPQDFRHPDWREVGFTPSQSHPVCSVKQSDGSFHFYYCGVIHDPLEPKKTVWIYAGSEQYKLHHRVSDWKFMALQGLALGMTVLDVERTQWNIRHHTGYEGNPIMGQSRAQEYGVSLPIWGWNVVSSFLRKRAVMTNEQAGILPSDGIGRIPWYASPLTLIGVHAVGVGTSFRRKP